MVEYAFLNFYKDVNDVQRELRHCHVYSPVLFDGITM